MDRLETMQKEMELLTAQTERLEQLVSAMAWIDRKKVPYTPSIHGDFVVWGRFENGRLIYTNVDDFGGTHFLILPTNIGDTQ